jgi:hypothetical protein
VLLLLLLLLQTAPAQLCFIGFLPNILDSKAAGRNAYIDALKGLANDYKDRCGMKMVSAWVGSQYVCLQ